MIRSYDDDDDGIKTGYTTTRYGTKYSTTLTTFALSLSEVAKLALRATLRFHHVKISPLGTERKKPPPVRVRLALGLLPWGGGMEG